MPPLPLPLLLVAQAGCFRFPYDAPASRKARVTRLGHFFFSLLPRPSAFAALFPGGLARVEPIQRQWFVYGPVLVSIPLPFHLCPLFSSFPCGFFRIRANGPGAAHLGGRSALLPHPVVLPPACVFFRSSPPAPPDQRQGLRRSLDDRPRTGRFLEAPKYCEFDLDRSRSDVTLRFPIGCGSVRSTQLAIRLYHAAEGRVPPSFFTAFSFLPLHC